MNLYMPEQYISEALFYTDVFPKRQYASSSVALLSELVARDEELPFFPRIIFPEQVCKKNERWNLTPDGDYYPSVASTMRFAFHVNSYAICDIIVIDMISPECWDIVSAILTTEAALFALIGVNYFDENNYCPRLNRIPIPWHFHSISVYPIEESDKKYEIQELRKKSIRNKNTRVKREE